MCNQDPKITRQAFFSQKERVPEFLRKKESQIRAKLGVVSGRGATLGGQILFTPGRSQDRGHRGCRGDAQMLSVFSLLIKRLFQNSI